MELRGDDKTRQIIEANEATEEDWNSEYNDLVLSIKVVSSLDEAVEHINRYGSHHTDAIITQDEAKAQRFMDIGRLSLRHVELLHPLRRRLPLWARGGGGDLHQQDPCPRTGRAWKGWSYTSIELSGKGHVVADYAGTMPRQFTHRKLK